ncbi:MAG: hypothetical protein CVU81_01465 [Euryarchaeota archaeon HGW-Euryarchaeota-1]|nr:MAG: hypothetical protein CVU81_01465 [Euryarchaeota archaeon HGW-Euryarchaeota-1]
MVEKNITIYNPDSNIALCTLWSDHNTILKLCCMGEKINMAGTLYTSQGISYLLQTLGEHPEINKLIIYGADMSSSGGDVVSLFNGDKGQKLPFEEKQIKPILDSTDLINLRTAFKENNIEKLKEAITSNYFPNKTSRDKIELLIQHAEISSFPLPITGTQIYDDSSVFRAWLKVLNQILKFGVEKHSEYGEPQVELQDLMVTIGLYGKEYVLEKDFFNHIKQESFEKHCDDILTPHLPEGVAYTYGSRALDHSIAKNQIDAMIKDLGEIPYTRRAIAVLWDHIKDNTSKNPPCIDIYQGIISGDYYNHTVFIRSNDMDKGWPVNMVGQIKLAEFIVNEINKNKGTQYKVGKVTTISKSAHLYEHSWNDVKKIIENNDRRFDEFVPDQKGHIVITPSNNGVVMAKHFAPTGDMIKKYEFKSLEDAKKQINRLGFSSDHAFYLGIELARAFKNPKNYHQT